MSPKSIAVVGGGISGLTATYWLARARERGSPIEEHLFDSSSRLGGALHTEQLDSCLVEAGADSFLSEKTEASELCQELGLGGELIGSQDEQRQTWVLHGGQLHRLPEGLELVIPTKIWPFVRTGLLSFRDKWAVAAEYFARSAGKPPNQDESVSSFFARHFPRSMVDTIIEPLLAAVYGGVADNLSAQAVLPRFVELEQRCGSLVRGVLESRRERLRRLGSQAPRRPPLFTTLRNGLGGLVEAIASRLAKERIHQGRLQVLAGREASQRGLYQLRFEDGGCFEAEAVILALPAYESARAVRAIDAALGSHLESIPYASSVIVALLYDRAACRGLPPGFGFLVPYAEGYRLRACTFAGNKFAGRVPPHQQLLRCFLGGVCDEAALELSDTEVLAVVRRELKEIVGLAAEPQAARVYRWPKVMAQYTVGHPARIQAVSACVERHPGLALAGNAYGGIGVPDCVRSGKQAALAALESLRLPVPTHERGARG